MADMQNYDLSSPSDRQEFQRFIIELIRNEINSYTKQSNNKNSNYIKPDTLSDIDRIRQLESIVLKGG
jgi:tRNA splicing ligase